MMRLYINASGGKLLFTEGPPAGVIAAARSLPIGTPIYLSYEFGRKRGGRSCLNKPELWDWAEQQIPRNLRLQHLAADLAAILLVVALAAGLPLILWGFLG